MTAGRGGRVPAGVRGVLRRPGRSRRGGPHRPDLTTGGYRVRDRRRHLRGVAVVIATGYCDRRGSDRRLRRLGADFRQLARRPVPQPVGRSGGRCPGGRGVGDRSAAGRRAGRAGRDVVLAVGRHTRLPRRYRGWTSCGGWTRWACSTARWTRIAPAPNPHCRSSAVPTDTTSTCRPSWTAASD